MHKRLMINRAGLLAISICTSALAGGSSTGLAPISELGAGSYGGFQGGLYPGGANVPPAGHLAAAMSAAEQVVPCNGAGTPDPSGWIVLLSIGLSNTCHEFSVFERQEDMNTARNARVVLVNGAAGGWSAALVADSSATYWQLVDQRLSALGLTAGQVQVVWLKEANPLPLPSFPTHATDLKGNLRTIVQILRDRFPNLRLCYLSSRIYGGYGTWEPEGYESGFAVKWLIEDQIGGADPGLNYDVDAGPVGSPLLLWGPYLWADGLTPRSDGLTWQQSDLEGDNTHPSAAGEQKVADLLSSFFATDPTAQPWYAATPGISLVSLDAEADAYVQSSTPAQNFGTAPDLRHQGGVAPIRTYFRFDTSVLTSPALFAKVGLRTVSENGAGGGLLSLVSESAWTETRISWANAPALDGGTLATIPQASRDGTIAGNVTDAVNASPTGLLTFALTNPDNGLRTYHSRENGQAPRLVVVVTTGPEIPAVSAPACIALSIGVLIAGAALVTRTSRPCRRGNRFAP